MNQAPHLASLWRRSFGAWVPPPGGRLAATFARARARVWLVPLLVLCCVVLVYYASAGGLNDWPIWGTYLDLQADGFRAGHTHVLLAPAPQLIHAADPYDRVNIRYWALDLSYYRGKYYTYWGPAPALIQAAVKAIFGINRVIGDQYIGFYSACLATLAGALLIERIGSRLFPSVSRLSLTLAVLAFAFANPMLHNVTTAGTYQSAILAGQGWLIAGLVGAFDAVWYGGSARAHRWRLLLAGLCWSLALASRVTVLPTVAVLIAATAVGESWSYERRWWRAVRDALWLGLPVATVGLSLLVYNKVRFDHFMEFGLNIQLSGYPTIRFDSKYWLPNLYSYALRAFVPSCQFPYLYQVWWMGKAAFPSWFTLPADYNLDEPVVGFLRAVPITWLAPFALLCVPRPINLQARSARACLWCLVVFAAAASLTGLTAIGVYAATMRYLSDVTPGLVLLGIFGGFALRERYEGLKASKLASAVFGVLAVATVGVGLLLGYQGYGGQFHRHNPKLDAKFVNALSVCGNAKPEVPRYNPF